MKLIKTVKGKEYEMQCSPEQAEVLLKDSRYRKAEDNSAAEKAAQEDWKQVPETQGNNRR